MKKAGVVILYNPNIEEIRRNMGSYVEHLDKLYVVDNSNTSHKDSVVDLSTKIEYIPNLKNNGISNVLNNTAVRAIQEGYDILLTMDQDSFFSEQMIQKYVAFADTLDWSKISVIGITPTDYSSYKSPKENLESTLNSVQLLITSGSFLNLKLYNLVGGFDERLFIDWVDYDYCLKSILAGYSISLVSNIYLFHVGGTPQKFLGRRVALYSPERYYFIFRNHLYMWYKYFKHFPKLIIRNIFVTLVLSLLPNIILAQNKAKFFSTLGRSIKDIPKIFKSN
ncbi:MAG TPA: hypothetical protein DEB09_02470 [Candidatus Magasanikbacteria bacterium]|nr:hypothetical protein [Candidatus Magasanikbacteria bacterium]